MASGLRRRNPQPGTDSVLIGDRRNVRGQGVDRVLALLDDHSDAGVIAAVTVQLHELHDVELGLLEDLHLADEHILQGEDALGLLLDLLADGLGDQLLHELAQLHLASLGGHDLRHLAADLADLRRLSVAVRLDLVRALRRERNHEHAHHVAVSGLHVHVGLDHGLPLADQGALLVTSEAHAVEVGEAVPALDLLDAQLDLLVGLVLIVVQVREVHLQDAALELLRRNLRALGAGHQGLAAVADAEDGRRLDVVPLLLQEGVAGLLLAALLAATLRQALVLADRHC
mmetsp:Transcript_8517/g.18707  ORF Transcript_8517/g.18707 Transcript_8517/m.18707 type:complete len:286 (+) Transcript_8517:23-880(+)